MLNTRELEKRWLRYKIKSYIPYAVIFTSIIIIFIIVLIFINSSDQKRNITTKTTQEKVKVSITEEAVWTPKTEQNNTKTKQSQKMQTTIAKIEKTPMIEHSTKNTKLTLVPSMGFIKHIQSEEQQPYYQTLHPKQNAPKKIQRKQRKVIQEQNAVEEEYMDIEQNNKNNMKKNMPKIKMQEVPQKNIITIERRDSQKDINDIIARFKKNNNPALSLFVAKKAYEIGDYEQAYNYALITNGINNDIEESWLIFAKSLVKLHRKNMAIKTLSEYIKYSHSGNAKVLLNEIKTGKFR